MSRRILVVDDEPDVLQAICGFLEDEGFSVRGVSSGGEALDVLAASPVPDVVLLDVMMPGLSGYDVIERMSELDGARDVPVIMMSAVDHVAKQPRGRWKAFVKKTFDIDKLLATIERLV